MRVQFEKTASQLLTDLSRILWVFKLCQICFLFCFSHLYTVYNFQTKDYANAIWPAEKRLIIALLAGKLFLEEMQWRLTCRSAYRHIVNFLHYQWFQSHLLLHLLHNPPYPHLLQVHASPHLNQDQRWLLKHPHLHQFSFLIYCAWRMKKPLRTWNSSSVQSVQRKILQNH